MGTNKTMNERIRAIWRGPQKQVAPQQPAGETLDSLAEWISTGKTTAKPANQGNADGAAGRGQQTQPDANTAMNQIIRQVAGR